MKSLLRYKENTLLSKDLHVQLSILEKHLDFFFHYLANLAFVKNDNLNKTHSKTSEIVYFVRDLTFISHKTSVLIWIQAVPHSDSIPERFLKFVLKKKSADDNKSTKIYPALKEV